MDVSSAVKNRLEVREFSSRSVSPEVRRDILDGGRLAPSGKNLQHWRFILVEDENDLNELADLSLTGDWVQNADFAVIVLTDPQYSYHKIDAGRSLTHMQFEAWSHGVGSCIYTGYDEGELREFFEIPDKFSVTAVVGFGYPADDGSGAKTREPLEEVVFKGKFGKPLSS